MISIITFIPKYKHEECAYKIQTLITTFTIAHAKCDWGEDQFKNLICAKPNDWNCKLFCIHESNSWQASLAPTLILVLSGRFDSFLFLLLWLLTCGARLQQIKFYIQIDLDLKIYWPRWDLFHNLWWDSLSDCTPPLSYHYVTMHTNSTMGRYY